MDLVPLYQKQGTQTFNQKTTMEKKNFKYYAMDLKSRKRSQYFETEEEAVKAAKEFNKQGGFALPMHISEQEV